MLPTSFSKFSEQFCGISLIIIIALSLFLAVAFFLSSKNLFYLAKTQKSINENVADFKTDKTKRKDRLMLLSLMCFFAFCMFSLCFLPIIGFEIASYFGFIAVIIFDGLYIAIDIKERRTIKAEKSETANVSNATMILLFIVLFILSFAMVVLLNYITYLIGNEVVAVLRYAPTMFFFMLLPYIVFIIRMLCGRKKQ